MLDSRWLTFDPCLAKTSHSPLVMATSSFIWHLKSSEGIKMNRVRTLTSKGFVCKRTVCACVWDLQWDCSLDSTGDIRAGDGSLLCTNGRSLFLTRSPTGRWSRRYWFEQKDRIYRGPVVNKGGRGEKNKKEMLFPYIHRFYIQGHRAIFIK